MAYSIQYSPNGVKPMISNYVNVSHAWFDYIKNHTDINLLGFTITSYSLEMYWLAIGEPC